MHLIRNKFKYLTRIMTMAQEIKMCFINNIHNNVL